MAGYSSTPLQKKLGIKDGARVAWLNAPRDFGKTIGALPDGVTLVNGRGGSFDVVQRTGLGEGLVDTKICSIDDTWSGLRFVRRLADRKNAGARA